VRNFFRGFGAVFYKEVLHVRRDPATLFFSLVIPLLQMVVLGFGIDTNIRQINTVVLNADGRRESRELIDRLKNSDTFHFIRYVQNDRDLNDAIIAGKARVGIKIPVDYSDRLLHNMSAQVLVLIDGSDSSIAGQAINVTTAIGLDESLRRVLQDRSTFAVDIRPKTAVQPGLPFPEFPLARLDRYSPAERHHFPHRFLHRPRERNAARSNSFSSRRFAPWGFFSASSFPISRSVFPSCV